MLTVELDPAFEAEIETAAESAGLGKSEFTARRCGQPSTAPPRRLPPGRR